MQEDDIIMDRNSLRRDHIERWPSKVYKAAEDIDYWDFDIFKLADVCNGNLIQFLLPYLLGRYGLIKAFHINPFALASFSQKIEAGYLKHNALYHNNVHGADVLRNVHCMIYTTGLKDYLTNLEIFASLVAAVCHDFEHTGTTNSFHVNSKSELAMIYNDRSVLENHHISATFFILKDRECNILSKLSREEYQQFRYLFVEMVLPTDMTYHFKLLKYVRDEVYREDEHTIEKSKLLALILHLCDISNPAKAWEVSRRFTDLIYSEMFAQGDREKVMGLPISALCNRQVTQIPESQIQFIDFIVEPTMRLFGDILDRMFDQRVEEERNSIQVDKSINSIWPRSNFLTKESFTMMEEPRYSSSPTNLPQHRARPWEEILQQNRKRWLNLCKKDPGARKSTIN